MTPRRTLCMLATIVVLGFTIACTDTPTSPTEVADASKQPFSSLLVPKGTAARAFTVSTRGTVSVTLSSTTPAGTVVGLGVGIPRANGAGCSLSQSQETVAGPLPQITVTAEAGLYCVQIFDVGTLAEPLPFTLSISHP